MSEAFSEYRLNRRFFVGGVDLVSVEKSSCTVDKSGPSVRRDMVRDRDLLMKNYKKER